MQTPHSVLYYPSIEFESDSWVKRALLIWDQIYRIVPENYIPNDSNEIKDLKDYGLIIDIPVSSSEKKKSAKLFLNFVKKLHYLPSGLNNATPNRLNLDKVDSRLYPLLDKIAKKTGCLNDGQWIELPPNFVRGYMFFLSQVIAESRNLVRSTDNLDSWAISPYFSERGNFPFEDIPFDEKNKGLYCSLIIEDVLPRNIESLSIKDIINFNKNRHDERKLFRDHISDLVDALPKIKNKDQWNDEILFKLEKIEKSKIDFRKGQSFWHSGMPASVFGIGVPVALSALGTEDNSIMRIASSFLLGAVATITNYSLIKRSRTPSLASYLVGIDEKCYHSNITSRTISNYASSIMHEFIND